MRKSILALIFLTSLLSCHAGEFIICLAGKKLTNVLRGYYVGDVQLSHREDSCLGYLHPYSSKRFNPIFFEKNIRAEVKEFLVNSMPKQADLLPIIIRVNRIFMYQPTQGTQENTCLDLSLSFIIPTDKGLQEDFTSSASVSVYQKNLPASLAGVIVKAFDQCFSQYTYRLNKGLLVPDIITPEQLRENPICKPGYFKCFTSKNPIKGIYRTWFDFRDNLPDTAIDFKILHHYNTDNPKLSKAYLKFSNGAEPKEIWGFCEGDSVYINWGQSFSLLTKEGYTLSTYCRSAEFTRDVVSAAIFGWFFGGLIGASVTGGVAAVSSDPDLAEKFKLDLFNGKLLPYEAADYTLISSRVVFFMSKVSDPRATLGIYIDGQLLCEMIPGHYFTVDLSCHHSTADIKLVSSVGSEKTEQIALELFSTDVYLLKVNKNHSINFSHQHDQMKKDIVWNRTKEKTICRAELFND